MIKLCINVFSQANDNNHTRQKKRKTLQVSLRIYDKDKKRNSKLNQVILHWVVYSSNSQYCWGPTDIILRYFVTSRVGCGSTSVLMEVSTANTWTSISDRALFFMKHTFCVLCVRIERGKHRGTYLMLFKCLYKRYVRG